MNALMPEKRQDKNGRVVTRHVKPVVTTAAKAIPAPLATPMASLSDQEKQLLAARNIMKALFVQTKADYYESPDGNMFDFRDINRLLALIPHESLAAVTERAESLDAAERKIVSFTFAEIARNYGSHLRNAERAEAMLHYSAELAPIVMKYAPAGKNAMEMHSMVMNLNVEMDIRFRGKDARLVSADEGEKTTIYGAAVTSFLTKEYLGKKPLSDLNWIGSNLDKIEGYKEVIRSHGSMSRAFVEEMINGDSPSLAGGYL